MNTKVNRKHSFVLSLYLNTNKMENLPSEDFLFFEFSFPNSIFIPSEFLHFRFRTFLIIVIKTEQQRTPGKNNTNTKTFIPSSSESPCWVLLECESVQLVFLPAVYAKQPYALNCSLNSLRYPCIETAQIEVDGIMKKSAQYKSLHQPSH